MTIRKVLVPLDGSDRDRLALNTAFIVARQFGARIDAMHVRVQPIDTLPFVGEGMSAALVQELVELSERERRRAPPSPTRPSRWCGRRPGFRWRRPAPPLQALLRPCGWSAMGRRKMLSRRQAGSPT
ncbi:MAG: universal stress protein [Rhodospirillales bacterium]